jgi:hypothetical protein
MTTPSIADWHAAFIEASTWTPHPLVLTRFVWDEARNDLGKFEFAYRGSFVCCKVSGLLIYARKSTDSDDRDWYLYGVDRTFRNTRDKVFHRHPSILIRMLAEMAAAELEDA